jgi:mono/diheme cytochrome c family protein
LAANLPNPPPNFTDPTWRRTAVPIDLFNTITNGRPQNGMPPFGPTSSNPLSDAERWHLVATIFDLGTMAETMSQGQSLYEANCLACHGADGSQVAAANLTDLDYWLNQSNEAIFTTLSGPTIAAHDFNLSEDERWLVTEYARTFGYSFPPIPTATIGGTVFNGTTNETVSGSQVLLQAFTADFQEQLSLETVVDADGHYQFDLTDVPSNWIYLITVTHDGLQFTSAADQISQAVPTLDLPVIVYEKSNDTTAVNIDQVHLILGFGQDIVEVSELYIINNLGTAVFVGESGDPAQGTVEFVLPAGAENVDFRRSFGSLESFTPAVEIISTDRGWADTLPLQPGHSGLSLLVSYQLPYRDGLTIAHPLLYRTNNITAIVPEVGVRLSGDDWTAQGVEELPGGTYSSYRYTPTAAGEALTLQLNGRPRLITDAAGNVIATRNQTAELIIGSTALLLAFTVAAYAIRTWRNPTAVRPEDYKRHALLQALAQLDDAYEAHQITPRQYERQREQIKANLISFWPDNRQ